MSIVANTIRGALAIMRGVLTAKVSRFYPLGARGRFPQKNFWEPYLGLKPRALYLAGGGGGSGGGGSGAGGASGAGGGASGAGGGGGGAAFWLQATSDVAIARAARILSVFIRVTPMQVDKRNAIRSRSAEGKRLSAAQDRRNNNPYRLHRSTAQRRGNTPRLAKGSVQIRGAVKSSQITGT